MSFISKKYQNIKANAMMTASDTATTGNSIIDLSVGDHDILTDQRIIDAAAKNKVIGHTLYTHPLGDPKFRDIIVKSIKEDYNCDLNIENIMVTIGAGHALYIALKGIIDVGDEVIVISPYYPAYIDQVSSVDGKIVLVKTCEENGFIPTIEDIKEKITHNTKAIIINSPNNPTGAIYPKSLLEDIYKLSIEEEFMILSDEVYTAFTYDDNQFTSMLEVDKNLTNSIVFKSMSKDYAMTGWRIGYMIAKEEVINIAKYINDGITYSAPTIGQEGSIEALKLRKEISTNIRSIYDERIKHALDKASIIDKINAKAPQGGIYLFINVENTGLDGSEFCKVLLDNGVLVLPGDIFGEDYKYYIRLTCNKDVKILEETFNRIEKICNK